MKILKKGNKLKTKIFTCQKCGTVFEANEMEYHWDSPNQWEIDNYGAEALLTDYCYCKCPVCGTKVYIKYYDGHEVES